MKLMRFYQSSRDLTIAFSHRHHYHFPPLNRSKRKKKTQKVKQQNKTTIFVGVGRYISSVISRRRQKVIRRENRGNESRRYNKGHEKSPFKWQKWNSLFPSFLIISCCFLAVMQERRTKSDNKRPTTTRKEVKLLIIHIFPSSHKQRHK